MAAAYAAYATQALNALETLLETTGVKIKPAVDFVSCGAGPNEHFVPNASLQTHLRKCHGERRPEVINNAAFYYGKYNDLDTITYRSTESSVEREVQGTQDSRTPRVQSLLVPEVDEQDVGVEHQGVIAAIRQIFTSVGTFYQQVQAWQRIPRSFATIKDTERELVAEVSLRRWLNTELHRSGVLMSDQLDDELVNYVVGLLDHPDFCQPDSLVLELQEFLGNNVANIVLGLWKFMIVEIGLHSVFKTDGTRAPSATTDRVPQVANERPINAPPQLNLTAEYDYKRRRASYRKKVGTKTGPAAYREMIEKHMIGLSQDTGRELVLGGGFYGEDENSAGVSNRRSGCRKGVDWWNFTDALEVRNRSRYQSESRISSKKRRKTSRSRSRSRCNSNCHIGAHRRRPDVNRLDKKDRHRRSRSRSRNREASSRRLTCRDSKRRSVSINCDRHGVRSDLSHQIRRRRYK